jgi:hypothetical protein
MTSFATQPITATNYCDWKPPFYGHAEFYGTTINDAIADIVWQWLCDDLRGRRAVFLQWNE